MKARLFVLSVVALCLTVGLIVLTGVHTTTARATESVKVQATPEPYPEPWNVEPLAQLGGFAHAVAISGTVAYVGIAEHLTTVDISTPTHPVAIGRSAPMPDTIEDVKIVGDLAYLADGRGGLRIVSITNPAAPVEIGHYDTVSDTIGLAVSGNYAYLAEDRNGLQIVDISNPAAPAPVGFYPLPAMVPDVAVVGNYVFVGRRDTGDFLSLDISDPAHPKPAGPRNWWGTEGAPTFVLAGEYMYVASGHELLVFDVTRHPTDLSHAENLVWLWYGSPSDLAVTGDYLYVAGGVLTVVSLAIPEKPLEIGYYQTDAERVAASGHCAYVTSEYRGGMRVIDARKPASPVEIAYYNEAFGEVTALTVQGNYAYVMDQVFAANRGALNVIDVADPAMMRKVGSATFPRLPLSIAVSGTLAYVGDRTGLSIFSIRDPNAPQELSFTDLEEYTQAVAVTGHYAYAATSGRGLKILDVSTPTQPNIVHTESGYDVTIAEKRAYGLDGWDPHVLKILDVSNPAEPVELGREEVRGSATRVKVAGRYACVAEGFLGMQVFDVTDPRAPVETGSFDTDSAWDVAVAGNLAYTLGAQGLHVIDVANPAGPVEVGFYPDLSGRLAATSKYIYVVAQEGGLEILRFTGKGSPIYPTYLPLITAFRP